MSSGEEIGKIIPLIRFLHIRLGGIEKPATRKVIVVIPSRSGPETPVKSQRERALSDSGRLAFPARASRKIKRDVDPTLRGRVDRLLKHRRAREHNDRVTRPYQASERAGELLERAGKFRARATLSFSHSPVAKTVPENFTAPECPLKQAMRHRSN